MNTDRPYTPARLAERWSCATEHVARLCRGGKLLTRTTKGGRWRIAIDEVERWESGGAETNRQNNRAAKSSSINQWLKARLRTAAYHGPRRGHKCTLTISDMQALFARSRGRCEVSGIEFDLSPMVSGERNPYRLSLDRIDTGRPYEMANCRLVCVVVNYAMGQWGEKVLRQVAKSMARKRDRSPA